MLILPLLLYCWLAKGRLTGGKHVCPPTYVFFSLEVYVMVVLKVSRPGVQVCALFALYVCISIMMTILVVPYYSSD